MNTIDRANTDPNAPDPAPRQTPASDGDAAEQAVDVLVVGAGIGGLYATYRFREQGLSMQCLEGASDIGGVWLHNRYPGSRVDIDSVDYSYFFSPELYREWVWSERYATQPELLRYVNHVADRFDLRPHIRLNTWLTGAEWRPATQRYHVTTSSGRRYSCRFLVMTTGQLSKARKPAFEGLDDFQGEWVQTSHWPDRDVPLRGRNIGVIGTGSSGVQAVPAMAPLARHLYVFQRTPNFIVPAQNGPQNLALWNAVRENVPEERERRFNTPGANHRTRGMLPAAHFSADEQKAMLEKQWDRGGQGMNTVFSDQTMNKEANDVVADFVRGKIRQIVEDPAVAEKLCPFDHPFGTRRLCLSDNYFETYNRDNVTLVDVREAPIERITRTGIQTAKGHYELDLIVFALGFEAFTGALDNANIRNEQNRAPTDHWNRGPRTLFGLMTTGFPNLFTVTGAGSTSVLATMTLVNEFHIDWIADCIAHMQKAGARTVEPTPEAEDAWTRHVAEAASKVLRLNVNNYMVHVNADGSRVFIPYVAGLNRYIAKVRESVAKGYEGFLFK